MDQLDLTAILAFSSKLKIKFFASFLVIKDNKILAISVQVSCRVQVSDHAKFCKKIVMLTLLLLYTKRTFQLVLVVYNAE